MHTVCPKEQYMLRQGYGGSTLAELFKGWTSTLLAKQKICTDKNYYYKFSQPTSDFPLKLDTSCKYFNCWLGKVGVWYIHVTTLDTLTTAFTKVKVIEPHFHLLHSPLNQNHIREHFTPPTGHSQVCYVALQGLALFYHGANMVVRNEYEMLLCVCWPSWRRVALSCCDAVMVGDLSTEVNRHVTVGWGGSLLWLTIISLSHGG